MEAWRPEGEGLLGPGPGAWGSRGGRPAPSWDRRGAAAAGTWLKRPRRDDAIPEIWTIGANPSPSPRSLQGDGGFADPRNVSPSSWYANDGAPRFHLPREVAGRTPWSKALKIARMEDGVEKTCGPFDDTYVVFSESDNFRTVDGTLFTCTCPAGDKAFGTQLCSHGAAVALKECRLRLRAQLVKHFEVAFRNEAPPFVPRQRQQRDSLKALAQQFVSLYTSKVSTNVLAGWLVEFIGALLLRVWCLSSTLGGGDKLLLPKGCTSVERPLRKLIIPPQHPNLRTPREKLKAFRSLFRDALSIIGTPEGVFNCFMRCWPADAEDAGMHRPKRTDGARPANAASSGRRRFSSTAAQRLSSTDSSESISVSSLSSVSTSYSDSSDSDSSSVEAVSNGSASELSRNAGSKVRLRDYLGHLFGAPSGIPVGGAFCDRDASASDMRTNSPLHPMLQFYCETVSRFRTASASFDTPMSNDELCRLLRLWGLLDVNVGEDVLNLESSRPAAQHSARSTDILALRLLQLRAKTATDPSAADDALDATELLVEAPYAVDLSRWLGWSPRFERRFGPLDSFLSRRSHMLERAGAAFVEVARGEFVKLPQTAGGGETGHASLLALFAQHLVARASGLAKKGEPLEDRFSAGGVERSAARKRVSPAVSPRQLPAEELVFFWRYVADGLRPLAAEFVEENGFAGLGATRTLAGVAGGASAEGGCAATVEKPAPARLPAKSRNLKAGAEAGVFASGREALMVRRPSPDLTGAPAAPAAPDPVAACPRHPRVAPASRAEADAAIVRVAQERLAGYRGGGAVSGLLSRALKTLSRDLYAAKSHFALELVQNCDDSEFARDVVPTVVVAGAVDGLYLSCNELGLTFADFEALCDIGRSTKTETKTEGVRDAETECVWDAASGKAEGSKIGKFGLGFKSVFRVSARPYIASGHFQFYFDDNHSSGLGMLLPQSFAGDALADTAGDAGRDASFLDNLPEYLQDLIHLNPEFFYSAGMNIWLPWREKYYEITDVRALLESIVPEWLLFLNRITKLCVLVVDRSGLVESRTIVRGLKSSEEGLQIIRLRESTSDLSEREPRALLAPHASTNSFLLFRGEATVIALLVTGIESSDLTFHSLCSGVSAPKSPLKKIPKDGEASALPGIVFSHLPVRSYGLPFHMHAPFNLTASREEIAEDDARNRKLFRTIESDFTRCFALLYGQFALRGLAALPSLELAQLPFRRPAAAALEALSRCLALPTWGGAPRPARSCVKFAVEDAAAVLADFPTRDAAVLLQRQLPAVCDPALLAGGGSAALEKLQVRDLREHDAIDWFAAAEQAAVENVPSGLCRAALLLLGFALKLGRGSSFRGDPHVQATLKSFAVFTLREQPDSPRALESLGPGVAPCYGVPHDALPAWLAGRPALSLDVSLPVQYSQFESFHTVALEYLGFVKFDETRALEAAVLPILLNAALDAEDEDFVEALAAAFRPGAPRAVQDRLRSAGTYVLVDVEGRGLRRQKMGSEVDSLFVFIPGGHFLKTLPPTPHHAAALGVASSIVSSYAVISDEYSRMHSEIDWLSAFESLGAAVFFENGGGTEVEIANENGTTKVTCAVSLGDGLKRQIAQFLASLKDSATLPGSGLEGGTCASPTYRIRLDWLLALMHLAVSATGGAAACERTVACAASLAASLVIHEEASFSSSRGYGGGTGGVRRLLQVVPWVPAEPNRSIASRGKSVSSPSGRFRSPAGLYSRAAFDVSPGLAALFPECEVVSEKFIALCGKRLASAAGRGTLVNFMENVCGVKPLLSSQFLCSKLAAQPRSIVPILRALACRNLEEAAGALNAATVCTLPLWSGGAVDVADLYGVPVHLERRELVVSSVSHAVDRMFPPDEPSEVKEAAVRLLKRAWAVEDKMTGDQLKRELVAGVEHGETPVDLFKYAYHINGLGPVGDTVMTALLYAGKIFSALTVHSSNTVVSNVVNADSLRELSACGTFLFFVSTETSAIVRFSRAETIEALRKIFHDFIACCGPSDRPVGDGGAHIVFLDPLEQVETSFNSFIRSIYEQFGAVALTTQLTKEVKKEGSGRLVKLMLIPGLCREFLTVFVLYLRWRLLAGGGGLDVPQSISFLQRLPSVLCEVFDAAGCGKVWHRWTARNGYSSEWRESDHFAFDGCVLLVCGAATFLTKRLELLMELLWPISGPIVDPAFAEFAASVLEHRIAPDESMRFPAPGAETTEAALVRFARLPVLQQSLKASEWQALVGAFARLKRAVSFDSVDDDEPVVLSGETAGGPAQVRMLRADDPAVRESATSCESDGDGSVDSPGERVRRCSTEQSGVATDTKKVRACSPPAVDTKGGRRVYVPRAGAAATNDGTKYGDYSGCTAHGTERQPPAFEGMELPTADSYALSVAAAEARLLRLQATGRRGEFAAYAALRRLFAAEIATGLFRVTWMNEVNELKQPYDLLVTLGGSDDGANLGGDPGLQEKPDVNQLGFSKTSPLLFHQGETYIEVKATQSGEKSFFDVSYNEWRFAQEKGERFEIWRVFRPMEEGQRVMRIVNPYRQWRAQKIGVQLAF